MSDKQRSYSGLKADLAAANAEVAQVMRERDHAKKEAELAYRKGYLDASRIVQKMVALNRAQTEMLFYYVELVVNQAQQS